MDKPENKLSDVFKFLGEAQIDMQKLAKDLLMPRKEETCFRCGEISDKCNCDELFI
jgi:hypothetical protein